MKSLIVISVISILSMWNNPVNPVGENSANITSNKKSYITLTYKCDRYKFTPKYIKSYDSYKACNAAKKKKKNSECYFCWKTAKKF